MNYPTNEPISDERKKQIAEDLRTFIERMAGGSANKASKILKGVSNAYISHVQNENWDVISDEAWRNIQNQVSINSGWQLVETKGNLFLKHLFADAKEHSNTYAITGNAGVGKTSTASQIAKDNVFVIKSNEYFTPTDFLAELLQLMGRDGFSNKISGQMKLIVQHLRKLEKPLIIIDEADKLHDRVLHFFISLYNELEGKCGLIIMATPYLQKRIDDGVLKNKKGYHEIYSRVGRNFLKVPKVTRKDVEKIAVANGLLDTLAIQSVVNTCEGDLRSVKRLVHAHLNKAN